MPLLPRLSGLWRNLFHKARKDQELTEEIEAYLEMLIEQKINAGLDPAEARREALPWSPEHDLDTDGDDEPLAMYVDDDDAPLDMEPEDLDLEWAPDDEPVEHPRYQILVALVDDAAIP